MSEAMKPCPVADELERRAESALIGANHPRAGGVAGILFRERATALREAAALVRQSSPATAREVEELRAEVERLREALGLADAALRGANMNMAVVERKISAALASKGEAA